MQLEIQCPTHGNIETLDLPDSYKDFEGEVLFLWHRVVVRVLVERERGSGLRSKSVKQAR